MQPFWEHPEGWYEKAGTLSTDEWIAEQTATLLRSDPAVRGRYLEIVVQNRVVILEGELRTAEARATAGRLAWTVPDVADVSNRLMVTGQG